MLHFRVTGRRFSSGSRADGGERHPPPKDQSGARGMVLLCGPEGRHLKKSEVPLSGLPFSSTERAWCPAVLFMSETRETQKLVALQNSERGEAPFTIY